MNSEWWDLSRIRVIKTSFLTKVVGKRRMEAHEMIEIEKQGLGVNCRVAVKIAKHSKAMV